MNLDVTVKVNNSIQSYVASNGTSNTPDSISLEFSARERVEARVYSIPGSGSLTITKSSENFTALCFVKVEVVTPNKSALLKLNGDSTGFTIAPIVTGQKAFFEATADFTTLLISNPDAAEINVGVSLFEKTP